MIAAAGTKIAPTTANQAEMDSRASERQVARLIGLALGSSFILIVALYSMVL